MTITVTLKRTGKVIAMYTVAPQTCLEAMQRLKEVYPRHTIRLAL